MSSLDLTYRWGEKARLPFPQTSTAPYLLKMRTSAFAVTPPEMLAMSALHLQQTLVKRHLLSGGMMRFCFASSWLTQSFQKNIFSGFWQ
jgi:hypothetical protein